MMVGVTISFPGKAPQVTAFMAESVAVLVKNSPYSSSAEYLRTMLSNLQHYFQHRMIHPRMSPMSFSTQSNPFQVERIPRTPSGRRNHSSVPIQKSCRYYERCLQQV